MSVVRWVFDDPVDLTTYTFEINPTEGGRPAFKKHIQYQNTVAPGGAVLVFEGRDEPQVIEVTGTILTQSTYDAFVLWFNKRHQIFLTDDQGLQYTIYITEFTPKRVRSALYPWKHTYTLRATVLG